MILSFSQYRTAVIEAYKLEQSCTTAPKSGRLFNLTLELVLFEQKHQLSETAAEPPPRPRLFA